ncbi:MAG: hypothetical protein AAF449_01135 [Myxococcota bacterium]
MNWSRRPIILAMMVAACDNSAPAPINPPTTEIETTLSGLVWREGPVRETLVVVRDGTGIVTQGRADMDGRFSLPIGAIAGQVELTSDGLRQRVIIDEVGDTVDDILLSPIGTIAEAYVDSPAVGTREQKLTIVSDFFQIPLRGDALVKLDRSLGSSCEDFEDTSVGPRTLGGLLQSGLRYLGQSMIEETGAPGRADDVVEALVRDISADGFFDGIGPNGQQLSFAGIEFDALLLRPRYINAMTSFLRSERNQSGFDASCFQRFFDELLLSTSALFPASTWIETEFVTGCASCRQLPNGDFSCRTDDCGPCGRCDIDFSGAQPVAACVADAGMCTGNCDECVATATVTDRFVCAPVPSVCSGTCATCGDNGDGGFSCQANAQQCGGNCAACAPSAETATEFNCAPVPSACLGDCSTCAGDGQTYSCQGDVNLCPGPMPSPISGVRCNECRQRADDLFLCEDVRSRCPADSEIALTACQNPSVCATTGIEDVRLMTWQCSAGECLETVSDVSRNCSRNTQGVDCGTLECGSPFSGCTQVISGNLCSEMGMQSRLCQQQTCSNGQCVGVRTVEQRRDCVFDADGRTCGSETCTRDGRQVREPLCCRSGQCNQPCGDCDP